MERTRGIPAWTAVLAAACLATAQAQEVKPAPGGEVRAPVVQSKSPDGPEVEIGVVGRVSLPTGTVESEMSLKYDDLFKSGIGFSVEGSVLWPRNEKWRIGPYLSVGWDRFDGKSFTDDFGDTLSPDKLEILTVLAGFRGIYNLGQHFTWDGHAALGAAHYSRTSGTLILSGTPVDVDVFKSGTTVAFDMGTRVAYDTGRVFFDVGLDLRVQGAPKEGDFSFSADPLTTLGLEFGAGIRF